MKKATIADIKSAHQATLKYIAWLEKEVNSLGKQQKLYKLQSEWHRLMYAKTLELETLKKSVSHS